MKAFVLAIVSFALFSSFSYTVEETTTPLDDQEKVTHRIQLCSYKKIVPIRVVETLRKLGATSVKFKKGSIYLTSPYKSEDEASRDLPYIKSLGFEEAEQVVQLDDQLITIDEFHEHYDEDGTLLDVGRPPVIRIWK